MRVINADRPYTGPDVDAAPSGPGDLHNVFNTRAFHWGPKHAVQHELVDVYNGAIPKEYDELFHPEQRVHIVNMLRLAWDDLASLAGQEMPLYSQPDNGSASARQKAEKREAICYGYNAAGRKREDGGIDMRGLMLVGGWYLVGLGEAVLMTLPDFQRQTPYFTWRDPRQHYPPIGYNFWEQQGLDGTMFAYRMNIAQLKARFKESSSEIDRAYTKRIISMGRTHTGWLPSPFTRAVPSNGHRDDENIWVWVGEYYSKDAWYVSTLEDEVVYLVASEHDMQGHPGICPVIAPGLFNPELPRSMLADQVSIQVAESRMYSQQLDYFDRSLYPPIFGSKLVGNKVKHGPGAYNEFDTTMGEKPAFFQAAPPNIVNADQMMQFGLVLMRILNRNPESFQGGGDANSAKAVAELKSGPIGTVQNYVWPSTIQGLPQLYSKAIRMDRRLWGSIRKSISGKTPDIRLNTGVLREGKRVGATYRPDVDLSGYEESIEIEPGVLLRAYQGRLEIMQLKGSGLMSQRTALEQMDVIGEPEEELRNIQNDQMEALLWQELQALAGQMQLAPGALAKVRDLINEENMDLFDAIRRLDEGGQLRLAPMGAPVGMGGPESMNPNDIAAAMQGLEAGGVPGGGAPSLEMIQGGLA